MIKQIFIVCANFIYLFFKLLPSKNRVTMISRQSNEITLDFKLLKNEIEEEYKNLSVITLCHKLEGGERASTLEKVKYIFHCFKQMYYIATSKVVVLDSYCILVSVLKHKKNLRIIQMWHSMGTMKKFGYQILDLEEGRSSKTAKAMRMHRNYDYILASSEAYAECLAEGFGYDIEKIKIYSLPRVDLLTSDKYKKEICNEIEKVYPQILKKKNIVYCPTFRKSEKEMSKQILRLIEGVDYSKYNLILKLHPLSKIKIDNKNVICDRTFSSFDMLFIADYVISDYSCIIYEAAILNIPLYFWTFDLKKYLHNRGLTFDYEKEVPGLVSEDIQEILREIDSEDYDNIKLENFRKKYVVNINDCTKKIVDFIVDIIEKNYKNGEEIEKSNIESIETLHMHISEKEKINKIMIK